MMEEIFRIKENKLHEKVILVEYDILSLLFVCEDSYGDLYLVLNKDGDSYYLSKSDKNKIRKMLGGETSMRNTFLDSTEFWLIETGTEINKDKVISISKEEIEEKYLPKKDFYYTIFNEEVKEFYKSL